MKTKVTIISLTLVAITVVARVITPFHGWKWVEEHSPDIIVVIPREPVSLAPSEYIENAPKSYFNITVVSILKGTNALNNIRLQTDHELKKGEACLVFGNWDNGNLKAFEEYRVVPLGFAYRQEMIAGKPLDEQIHILFRLAADNLDQKIQKYQEEKERLKQAVK